MPNRNDAATPSDLAAAMLNGLEKRSFFRKPGPAAPPQLGPAPAGGAERIREANARMGESSAHPSHGVCKRVWKYLQKRLHGPVFARQSHVNAVAADSIGQLQQHVAQLTEQVNALHRLVAGDVQTACAATNARLNECLFDVHQLRKAVREAGLDAAAAIADAPPVPVDPVHAIEGLFLQTRLPAPPAKVLVVSPVGLHALDLASLGFQVVLSGAAGPTVSHPELRAAADGDSPFPDESFDIAVSLCGEGGTGIAGENLARLLVPGGKVVGSHPIRNGVPSPAEVAKLVEPFRVAEVLYARRAGHGWSLGAKPTPDAELVLWTANRGA